MRKITYLFFTLIALAFSTQVQGQCDYQLQMNDSFGDGWNGFEVTITHTLADNTTVVNTYTNVTLDDGDVGFFNIPGVNTGDLIDVTQTAAGDWPGEVSFQLVNALGGLEGPVGDENNNIVDHAVACPPCDIPDVTFTVVSNCPANSDFTIDVTINGVGTASGVTITDDQATAPVQTSGPFPITINYGAYTNGTAVVVSVANDDNAVCTVNSSSLTFDQGCPPANDDCAGAIELFCGDTDIPGDTSDATPDASLACGEVDGDANVVWYVFNSAAANTVTIDTCGSGYDTSLAIFTGSCGSLTCFANNDDSCATQSSITFQSQPATTYYIAVEGFGGASGTFDISVVCAPPCSPAEPNQDCASAVALGSVETQVDVLGIDSTCSTVNVANPACDPFGVIADVWYSFTGPPNGAVDITRTLGTATAIHYAIYEGSCGSLTLFADDPETDECVADASGTTSVSGLVSGQTYYLQLWNDGTSTPEEGTFDLSIVENTTLSNPEAQIDQFEFYPNPVKDKLTLNAQSPIDAIEVYNILGQRVMMAKPNAAQADMDMSSLGSGTYFVKVSAGTVSDTIRIIKK